MNEDPYRVLGIERGATADEIKNAYRRLAKQYHPDRNGGSAEAEAKMKDINDAYAKVMDELRHGGSSSNSSGYSGSSYGNSNGYGQGAYRGYGPYGGFGGYGYGNASSYGGGYTGGSPQFTQVRNYLSARRYAEAMNALNAIPSHTAEWYYCAAQAMVGMGNRIAALDYAQQAVNMDPANAAYQDLLSHLEYASGGYSRESAGFGGVPCATCTGNSCLSSYFFMQFLCCCCSGARGCCCPGVYYGC